MTELWIPAPDDFPIEQSVEEVQEILNRAKSGDIAHIFPKGAKQVFCVENGVYQAHGVVDDFSPKGKVTLWSPYFAAPKSVQEAFRPDDARTFGVDDISLIQREPAELYIPQASRGRFRYLSEASVTTKEGTHVVRVDSYFNGWVSGRTNSGDRVTGGASFFQPYK